MNNFDVQEILNLINQSINRGQRQDEEQQENNNPQNIQNNHNQMIVEEFKKDWADEMEAESPDLYQLQRRQINLREIHQPIKCPSYGFICSVASYKNRYIFLGTSMDQFFCYDSFSHKIIFEDYRHHDWVLSIQVIRIDDVDIVISGGGLYDKSLCFYDLTFIDKGTIRFINQITAHIKSITKIHYIEDKKLLITCGSDHFFKIWQLTIRKINNVMEQEHQSDQNQEEISQNEAQIPETREGQDQQQNDDNLDDNLSNTSDYLSCDEETGLKINLKLIQAIGETSQVYSFCESDDNFMSYGTGQGFIKVLKFNPNQNKAKQVRSLKFQRSIWCLQRFINFKYLVGYSFQTQGRVDVINVVTGQHIMKFFNFNQCIHSFKIITKLKEEKIVIKNKDEFIKQCKNSIALVGASKLGQVKIINIGDRISTPIEYQYLYNQNIEWIPWNPLTFFKTKEQDDENPEFEKFSVFCSTGNSENERSKLISLIKFDWYV